MAEILAARRDGRRYPWSTNVLWRVHGVLFGHFLSPSSQDVAISCFACESHPAQWGGTLLLTKRAGKWEPVWYRPGVITQRCRRITLATGRQILFCEGSDGGMGRRFHDLYVVDFMNPKLPAGGNVLRAHSFDSHYLAGVEHQIQFIDRVTFLEGKPGDLLVRVRARHGRKDSPNASAPVSQYVIDFRLVGEKLKVTPQTAAAARLFGAEAQ